MKITFAPGCFDHIEFENQEELDALMAQIQEMADSGELEKQAVLIDPTDFLSEEEINQLLEEVSEEIDVEELSPSFPNKRTLH